MLGVYFHIPFCRHACHYCDFHFSTLLKNKEEVIDCMHVELERRKEEWVHSELSSIYFGGGTPSVLNENEFKKLFNPLVPGISNTTEITVEVNPEDVTLPFLNQMRAFGVNRLSIGVQSFFDDDLHGMNRKHSGQEAESAIKRAQDVGFENLTADLIFGIPHSSTSKFLMNIEKLFSFSLPHFSSYALTIEEKTAFGKWEKQGKLFEVPDERMENEFFLLHNLSEKAGYEHYELSNYALVGRRSVHNSNYWKGIPYVGIGPGAHSYSHGNRRWNVSNNNEYVRSIRSEDGRYYELEKLRVVDKLNERLMTGLRTKEGVLWNEFPSSWREEHANVLEEWQKKQWLQQDEKGFSLLPAGWLISNNLISHLFLTHED